MVKGLRVVVGRLRFLSFGCWVPGHLFLGFSQWRFRL